MHRLNILIIGSSTFVSTINELKSYFKFNVLSNQKKISELSVKNFDGIIYCEDNFGKKESIEILNTFDCFKVLASSNTEKNNLNYDNIIKLPTSVQDINQIVEKTAAKKQFNFNSSIVVKSYLLDKNEKKLLKNNKSIILTEKEIQLLELLLSKKKPVSKNDILSIVWNYSSDADTHTVETHIYRLRKKINETFLDENFIINGKEGYYL